MSGFPFFGDWTLHASCFTSFQKKMGNSSKTKQKPKKSPNIVCRPGSSSKKRDRKKKFFLHCLTSLKMTEKCNKFSVWETFSLGMQVACSLQVSTYSMIRCSFCIKREFPNKNFLRNIFLCFSCEFQLLQWTNVVWHFVKCRSSVWPVVSLYSRPRTIQICLFLNLRLVNAHKTVQAMIWTLASCIAGLVQTERRPEGYNQGILQEALQQWPHDEGGHHHCAQKIRHHTHGQGTAGHDPLYQPER